MASFDTKFIVSQTIRLSPLEAEDELNKLARLLPTKQDVIINYQVDLGDVDFDLNKEDVIELMKLPHDLCIKCIMKVGGFDEPRAKLIYKTFRNKQVGSNEE